MASPEPAVGVTLGRYQLVASLGRGGMADVFLALAQGELGFTKLVVLKCMRVTDQEQAFTSMFFDEVRLAARLSHPNIVNTFDGGDAGGTYFLAMEFLEGQPLHQVYRAWSVRQPKPQVWALVMAEVLAGLGYAHGLKDFDGRPLQVVHRDVSPQNIFLTYDGAVKLMDFGIAKTVASATHTDTGLVKGKIRYMSPEQFHGHPVDQRSDLFSAGVVLWELLAGRKLLSGEVAPVMHRLLSPEPLPRLASVLPRVPPRLDDLVARALEKDPARRYQTAAEMRADLLAFLREAGSLEPRELGHELLETFADARARVRAQVEAHVQASRHVQRIQDLGSLMLGASPDTPSSTNLRPLLPDTAGVPRLRLGEPTRLDGPEAARLAGVEPTRLEGPESTRVAEPEATRVAAPGEAGGPDAELTIAAPLDAPPGPAPRRGWVGPALLLAALALLGSLVTLAWLSATARPATPQAVAAPLVPTAAPPAPAAPPPRPAPAPAEAAAPAPGPTPAEALAAPAAPAPPPVDAAAVEGPRGAAAEPAAAPARASDGARAPARASTEGARAPARPAAAPPRAASSRPQGAGTRAAAAAVGGVTGSRPPPAPEEPAPPAPRAAEEPAPPAAAPPPAEPSPQRAPPPRPGLTRAQVAQVVRAHQDAIQDCYDHATLDGKPIRGKVALSIGLSGAGVVTQVDLDSSILERGAQLERCIAEAARRWRFPATGDGEPARVSYTFNFE